MVNFIAINMAFPAIIFTTLLGFVGFYWLIVIMGLIDIDILDIEFDSDVEASGGFSGLLLSFGLTGVPITVAISFLVLWAWAFSYWGTWLITLLILNVWLKGVLAFVVIIISCSFSILLSALCVRPFKRLFVTHQAISKASIVGKACEITSLTVDSAFGQAIFDDGGAGVILDVYCDDENRLHKGEQAIIINYDDQIDRYQIGEI